MTVRHAIAPLDLAHPAPELRRQLLEEIAAGNDVEIDLEHAGYLCTAAIGMLLTVSRQAREAGRRVTLARCSAPTRAYFRAARLDERLELVA